MRTLRVALAVSALVLVPFGPVQAQEVGFGIAESFVEIHGYADLTYFDFQKEGDPVLPFTDGGGIPTFDNNHIALYFGANLAENLKFVSEFHYEHSIEEPELPQANIRWELAKPLVLTFGRFWFPFGTLGKDKIYQPTAELVSYPYTVSQALPFHYADNGVKVGGMFHPISYELAVVNGFAGLDEEGGILLRGLAQDNNQNKRVAGRLAVHPVGGLELGASYTTGKWDDNNEANISLWGADATFAVGPLVLEGEYIGGSIENPDDAVATVDGEPRRNPPGCELADPPTCAALQDNFGLLTVGDHDRTAYYVQAAYRVLENRLGLNSLDVIVRYDAFERDEEEDVGDRSRFTMGVNAAPQPHLRLKAEYQIVSEKSDPDRDNNGVMLQAVIDF